MKSSPASRSSLARNLSRARRLGLLLVSASSLASAATVYWTGDQDAFWNTNNAGNRNWSSAAGSNVDAAFPAIGDSVVFGIPGSQNPNTLLGANFSLASLLANANAGSINLGSTADTNRTLTLGAGGLTLGAGAGPLSLLDGVSVTLGANQAWSNLSGSALTVQGPVNLGANTLTVTGSGNTTLSGAIANGTLTKSGTGTLTLAGANTYAGATTVNGGSLTVDATLGGSIGASSALSMGGATFTLNGGAGLVTQTFNGLSLTGGAAGIVFTSGNAGSSLNLGAITANAGGTVNFTLPASGSIKTTQANTNGILGPWATVGGTDYARNDGSGNIVAAAIAGSAESTWTDPTANYSYVAGGSTSLSGSRSFNTLKLNISGGGSNIVMGGNNITANGILNISNATTTFTTSGGRFNIGASGILAFGGSAGTTINAIVQGTGDLVKFGNGTLTLANASNSFGGVGQKIYINAGTVSYGSNGNLGDTANVIVLQGGTLLNTSNGITIPRNITVNPMAGNTISVSSTSGAYTHVYSGILSGVGSITFAPNNAGRHIQLTNNANNFGGAGQTMTIAGSGGALIITDGQQLGSTLNTILQTSGSLVIDGNTTVSQRLGSSMTIVAAAGREVTLNGAFTGTTLTLNSSVSSPAPVPDSTSTVILDGDLSAGTANITVNNGVVRIGTNATLPAKLGVVTMANAATVFDLNGRDPTISGLATGGASAEVRGNKTGTGSNTLTLDTTGTDRSFAGQIVNGGLLPLNLTKSGTNTQTLSGTSTYTGATLVERGGLTVSGQLSGTSGVTVRGGSTLTLSNASALGVTTTVTLGGSSGGGTLATTLSTSISSLSFGAGRSTLNTTAGQTLTIASLGTVAAGAVLNMATTGTNAFSPSMTNGIVGGWAIGALSGNPQNGGFLTVDSGNLIVKTLASYTATETDTNFANWLTADNVRVTAPLANITTRQINSLSVVNNGASWSIAANNTLTLASGGLITANNNAATISGGTLSSPGHLYLHGGGSSTTTISSALSANGGAGALVVNTAGTYALSNANNSIGDIFVTAGTLTSSTTGALGGNGNIHLLAGALNLTASQTLNKNITVGVAGASLRGITSAAPVFEVNSTINLLGNLAMGGSGTKGVMNLNGSIEGSGAISANNTDNASTASVVFHAQNSFSGGFSTTGGGQAKLISIGVGHDEALGSGTISLGVANVFTAVNPNIRLANATTLSAGMGFDGANRLELAGPITLNGATVSLNTIGSGTYAVSGNIGETGGSRALVKTGTERIELSGASTYTGSTTVRAGTLFIGGNAPSGLPGALGNASSAVILADATSATSDNVALLTSAAITVGRDMLANNNNSAGTTTIGGSGAHVSAFTGTTTLNRDVILAAANGGTVHFNRSGAGKITGGFGIAKEGLGTVVLGGANDYSGTTLVNAGTLLVNGSTAAASTVTVGASGTLGGSGRVGGAILGAGLVSPGNSPGILAAASVTGSENTDFAFEFTQAGAPTWANSLASGNDVLRLTAPTPFVNPLAAGNVVNFYVADYGVYQGGFYTDLDEDFTASIEDATFNFYREFAGGPVTFEGKTYIAFSPYDLTLSGVSVVQVASADFAGGTVADGWVMQVVAIPEPSTLVLLGLALAGAAFARRRRA